MKKYLLLWFSSLGAAYAAAETATQLGGEILELFPFVSRGHLFLQIPQAIDVPKFLASLSTKPDNLESFLDLPDKVLKSYLSLTSPPLGDDLLICEYSFLGETLRVATQASNSGLEILDVRFMRDTTGHSYFMATGPSGDCSSFVQHLVPSAGKILQLKNPNEKLREFFPRPN